MPSSLVETQFLWSGAASRTVTSSAMVWTDPITLNAEDWDGMITMSADNQGTPASGDTATFYLGRSTGDVLGDTGNDFDTDEHAPLLAVLDTFASNTPGEDPARLTIPVEISGCTAVRIGVVCPNAATRNIVVRVRLETHRPQ